MSSKEWYLGSRKKTIGPMTSQRVRLYIEKGKTSEKTRVRKGEEGDWKLLKDERNFNEDWVGPSADEMDESEIGPESDLMDSGAVARVEPPVDRDEETADPDVTVKMTEQQVLEGATPVESDDDSEADDEEPDEEDPDEADEDDEDNEEAEEPAKPVKKKRGLKGKSKAKKAPKKAPKKADPPEPVPELQLAYKFDKPDVWHAFRAGLQRDRLLVALGSMFVGVLVSLVFLVFAFVGGKIHPVVALGVMALGLGSAVSVMNIGFGVLSFHSRGTIMGETPTLTQCLYFAKNHALTLAAVPFLASVLPLVPLVLLVILAFLQKIPWLGPIGTGFLYGIHIVLGFVTVVLCLMAGMAWTFTPVVVGFYETGIKETLEKQFEFLRDSFIRFMFRSFWPGLGLLGFTLLLVLLSAMTLVVPVFIQGVVNGGSALGPMLSGGFGRPRSSFSGRASFGSGRSGSGSGSRSSSSGWGFGGGVSAPKIPDLSLSMKSVKVADLVTNPRGYAGRELYFKAYWRGFKSGRAVLSDLGGNAEMRFDIHKLGMRRNSQFLNKLKTFASVTLGVRMYAADKQQYAFGEVLGLQLDKASSGVRLYPTAAEIRKEKDRLAAEKAEQERRERERKAKHERVMTKAKELLAARDLEGFVALTKSRDWSVLNQREQYKLEGQGRELQKQQLFQSMKDQIKALLAKKDIAAIHKLYSFKVKRSLSREQNGELSKVVKDGLKELEQAIPNPMEVEADGVTLKLDFSKVYYTLHPTAVTFVEAMSPSRKAKKPVKLRVSYYWVHSMSSESAINGQGPHVEKGFSGTKVSKSESSVDIVIDLAKVKGKVIKFRAR